MSRSAEETQQLEERIRRMKLNSERLQRRHLEVEQDKLHAAQQNALVQKVAPSAWVLHHPQADDYEDSRPPPQSPSEDSPVGRVRGRGRGRGLEPRRSWNNEHDDRTEDEPRPRRGGPPSDRGGQTPDRGQGRDRWSPKRSPTSPGFPPNFAGGNRDDGGSGDMRRTPRRGRGGGVGGRGRGGGGWGGGGGDGDVNDDVISSKVFSNTYLEGSPHKPKFRLAEGDGPPPDPMYSYLNDSQREGERNVDRRRENNRRMDNFDRRKEGNRGMGHRAERGTGSARMNSNQNSRPMRSQQSYEEWRRERDVIDQKRIDRQKKSDGNWSREWDNDKIVQNEVSPPRHGGGDGGTGSWDHNRRRYNNRFGDFIDPSFQKRSRTRSNSQQDSPPGDAKTPREGDNSYQEETRERRPFQRRQSGRQLSNEGHFNRPRKTSSSEEAERPRGSARLSLAAARLEAARNATGPVASTLRQSDTDVCTITLPSSGSPGTPPEAPLKSRMSPMSPMSPDGPATRAAQGSPSPGKGGVAQPSPPTHPTLKVSVRTDESGKRTMIVEGVDCDALPAELGIHSKKANDVGTGGRKKRQILKTRKQRAPRLVQHKDDDGSWEDVSSEEDVSFVADLPAAPLQEPTSTRTLDVSSGPESLDPIPAPNKEEELLWEEFHPAGFQNNMTLAMVTETALKALLSKGDESGSEDASEQRKTDPVADFVVGDKSDKADEAGSIVDPMLVVTQIVKAEVDCMSLTSVTTDSSLPEDINLSKNDMKPDHSLSVDAEELSGPVSILHVSKEEESSECDGSFQSAGSPKSQGTSDENAHKSAENCDTLKDECSNEDFELKLSKSDGKEASDVESAEEMLDAETEQSSGPVEAAELSEKMEEAEEGSHESGKAEEPGSVVDSEEQLEAVEPSCTEKVTEQPHIECEQQSVKIIEEQTMELSEKSEELTEQTVELSEKGEEAAEQTVELSEKGKEAAEQTVELSEKGEEAAEQTVELSEKSEDAAKQTVELSEKSEEAAEQTVELSEKSEDAAKQTVELSEKGEEAAEQTVELSEKGKEAAEQTVELSEKGEEAAEQTVELSEKSEDAAKQTVELSEKSEEAAEKAVNGDCSAEGATAETKNEILPNDKHSELSERSAEVDSNNCESKERVKDGNEPVSKTGDDAVANESDSNKSGSKPVESVLDEVSASSKDLDSGTKTSAVETSDMTR